MGGPRVDQVNNATNTTVRNTEDVITAQKGDTLDSIAKRENIPLSDLKEANPKIDPKKPLVQGQDVKYPKDLLVQHGENTLEKVADRMGIDRGVLIKANAGHIKDPNNLREGQAIKLPKDFFEVQKRGTPMKEKTIAKDGINLPKGTGKITGGDGAVVYRPPKVKIGGVEVPLPDVILTDGKGVGVGKTSNKHDGTGESNTTRRREDEQKILNTRPKDERDIDNRKKPKLETGKLKSANDSQELDEELRKRLAEEAADFARKAGR